MGALTRALLFSRTMRTIDFDYHLPEELIADRPLPDRSASRMLVVHRDTGLIEHRHFSDILDYVQPGDHFVLNNTKVVPARYFSNDGSIKHKRQNVSGKVFSFAKYLLATLDRVSLTFLWQREKLLMIDLLDHKGVSSMTN